ncbi:LOW QUALITY PROTEIN: chromatin assembly factor 1 subunit A-like [Haliotis rubra]|uniref:LOW QUALITY PROTEIN: chromatin assembly factor 1 subunit A-like n=1 Tax=Haliotis rubra TaxID=36100 RepID=UPI001EE57FAF|nr:LOW QUALITY PROTEIN: chromatin assembly factor 1 subunit A-like [Haliotis rubra]
MAQVANCAEKHVDLSGVQSSEDVTIVDDDDSPSSSKKLKQARLPFKPIGPKSQICVNPAPHGVPKKRKLSDQESPSAKAPKIFSKHQADRLKHDIPEKTQSDIVDHDNEVSSSSEAENVPVTGPKRKACETNILERFIRKSSQEEISSTNEVVDLTEISEEIVDNSDNANASLEVTSSKGVKKARNKLTDTSNEQAQLVDEDGAGVQPENINNGVARKDENEAEKEISISESECKGEGNKAENTSVAEPGPIKCVDVDMVEEKDAPTSQDKEEVTEVDTAKLNDLDASVISGQSDENKSLELNASSSSKSDSDEESSTSSDESDDEVNDTSLNGTQNSCGDVSINDSLADNSGSSLDKSPTVNTSACKTPKTKTQKASVSKTPGGSTLQTSTPKNLRERPASIKMSEIKKLERKQEQEAKRQKIREQKEQERQQQKEKKEQEKLEAKKKRDGEKAEKERKKKEEKDKKERERQEKKDQLEREKQEKLQQKEEEKKKKQEIIDAKMEEKRKKDEEKQREEDEKNKKKQKEKQSFTSFFIKKAQSQAPSKVKEQSHFFMPFEVKKDMFLAPPTRRELEEGDKAALDQHLQTQNDQPLYIKEITNSSYQKKHSSRTLPRLAVSAPSDVDDEDSVKCLDTVEEDKNKNLVRHHCKLLQFHTNYRPPYYGTWRKMSQVLKPRNPFKQDTELFDYEVDSDDEWEEEEPGESVSSSEDEGDEKEDKDEDEEEEEDGWMVPHGYLSEDEGCEQDEEITPDVLKARQMAKQEAWEAEQKRQKQPVRAVVIGLAWEGEAIAANLAAKLAQFQAVCLSMVPIDTRSRPADSTGGGKDGDRTSFGKGNRKPVPEEAMPDLIRLLHGNLIGIKKLIKEFRLYWKKKTSGSLGEAGDDNMDVDESVTDKNASVLESSCTDEKNAQVSAVDVSSGGVEGDGSKDTPDGWGMSKRQLEMKIMSIAVRERRPNFKKVCWYVKEEVLKQYKMEELVLPNTWQYVSKGLIKVKNEEAAGRKTPNNLSESFTDSVSVIMKEEPAAEDAEAKPLPKDQPSIMQFAKKMQPSELPKPKIRRVQLKPASPVPMPSAERYPVTDLDLSAGEEVLGPYKTLPKDQRSIMDFAKKPQNGARTVPPNVVKNMLLSPKSSSADVNTSPKQILSKETTPKRKISKETRETTPKQKMSRETTPKQKISRETTPKQTVSRETTPKQTVSRETTPKQTVSRETTLKEDTETMSLKGIAPTPSVTAVPTMNNVVAKKNVISASKEEAMDVDDCIIID